MENTEILKIIVWPIMALLSVCAGFIIFRKQIGQIISCVSHVKTKSVEIKMASQVSVSEKVDKDQIEMLLCKFAEHIQPVEENIEKTIAAKNISEPQEVIKILRGHAALWLLAYQYEIIYHIIFGTQISFLHHLNANPGGLEKSDVTPFYDRSVALGLRDFTKDKYMEYLIDSGLVEVKDDKYVLARVGKGFLLFLLEANKDLDKGL